MYISSLLIEAGHAPVFARLFARSMPSAAADAQSDAASDPLREAMRATSTAADLMQGVDRALVDGRIDRAEFGVDAAVDQRAIGALQIGGGVVAHIASRRSDATSRWASAAATALGERRRVTVSISSASMASAWCRPMRLASLSGSDAIPASM